MYKLDKAPYGPKRAPRAWYDRLSSFLLSHGYSRGKINNTLFLRKKGDHALLIQVYIDDIIFGGTEAALRAEFAKLMASEFEMSMMEELNFILGIQIHQGQTGTSIHQQKYIKELITKFGTLDAKVSYTSMATTTRLDKDNSGVGVDDTKYKRMIGSFLYLITSKPDIVFSVGIYARF